MAFVLCLQKLYDALKLRNLAFEKRHGLGEARAVAVKRTAWH
jgi:hypothetical protein